MLKILPRLNRRLSLKNLNKPVKSQLPAPVVETCQTKRAYALAHSRLPARRHHPIRRPSLCLVPRAASTAVAAPKRPMWRSRVGSLLKRWPCPSARASWPAWLCGLCGHQSGQTGWHPMAWRKRRCQSLKKHLRLGRPGRYWEKIPGL